MGVKVVGILHGVSKETKRDYTVLHVLKEFEEYQKPFSVGQCTESVYVRDNINVNVGDIVEILYTKGYQGKAVVFAVNVIKDKE